ncbi:oxidoreductase [Neptunitalea chrysea]|uniref:Oxidoreductase n=1 Tax=Neptunitalea chrysea TaxID=1647581 RepID=A0A9W6EU35_9FLAO|nr:SDR family oxidoreductase [Neptunitalea chrysea]GLB52985.1 oxidoreductase [Neptunitalea chrysea]
MKNVALITGASSGIGKEFAHIHAEKGGDLIIVARNEAKLNALKTELEAKYSIEVVVLVKDLTAPTAPLEIYTEVKESGILLGYLINNAGFGGQGYFHERAWEEDLSMIQLNVISLTALTRYFLPDFVAANKGKILNVSSTAAFMPGPLQAVYYATKAYVTSFSNAIAEELSYTNVTVTVLMPGATETEFARISGMDKTDLFDKAASARSVAEDGYNGMIAGKLDVISGLSFSLRMLVSISPLLPKKVLLKNIKNMQETV